MLLSIADARPRNNESSRAREIIPSSLLGNAQTFVGFLEEYYKFLNQDGLPSREIASIRTLKDIDLVSEKYLEKIEELIGKSIPSSRVINKVELYKIIVKYYNTRGSEDSIHSFFKIFFNEFVEIFYPKEFLFNTSSGSGYWSSRDILSNVDYDIPIRQISDVAAKTFGGIKFSPAVNDGSGNLISIRFHSAIVDQYEILVDYWKGVTSVTPGLKSTLLIDAVDLFDGSITYSIPDKLFFNGFGIDGKPKYSEKLPNDNIPFIGTPSRIEWNGSKWIFTIGSSLGDVFAFYCDDDVIDPIGLVWLSGWYSAIGVPITGSITSITHTDPTNGQIFAALGNDSSFSADVTISANILSSEWTDAYTPINRTYLTNNPLPLNDIPIGYFSVVNGRKIRPFVIGSTANVNDEFVWYKFSTEEWIYENNRSFPSDNFKLFDGHYWQDYSYVIKTNLDANEWINVYNKFVHPVGLQLFSAIAIEMIVRNEWYEEMNYNSPDLENNFAWLESLVPPARLRTNLLGHHTPKYQPGWLRDKILKYLFKYLLPDEENLLRLLLLNHNLRYGPVDVQTSFVRKKWQEYEKFIDPCQLNAGWLNKTIAEAEEEFSVTNSCRIHNISVFGKETNIFEYSFYDTDFGEGIGVWEDSSFDEGSGEGSGVWNESSYEDL